MREGRKKEASKMYMYMYFATLPLILGLHMYIVACGGLCVCDCFSYPIIIGVSFFEVRHICYIP